MKVNMPKEPWYIIPKAEIKDKRAIVIGGGLAGTSAAYSLSKRNWQVTIIERHSSLAPEASGNEVGIITPVISHKNDLIGEFYLAGFNHTISHLNYLKDQGLILPFEQCGVIDISNSKAGRDIENLVVGDKVHAIPPECASAVCGVGISTPSLYLPECGWTSPARLCEAYIMAAGDNIKTILCTNIMSIQKILNVWSVIDSDGDIIASAPVVIIANANDAINFTQCDWLPLVPVGGQITYLQGINLGLKTILNYDSGYITPQIDGRHHVGATFRRGSNDVSITDADHKTNLENLAKYINIGDIDYKNLKGRAALRATTPDRRPAIGAVPDVQAFNRDYSDLHHGRKKQYPSGKYLDGLYISAGHGARGLTSAPIGGEIIAAMINNEPMPLEQKLITALNPARFIIRKLQRPA